MMIVDALLRQRRFRVLPDGETRSLVRKRPIPPLTRAVAVADARTPTATCSRVGCSTFSQAATRTRDVYEQTV